jgi:hypothetical protein
VRIVEFDHFDFSITKSGDNIYCQELLPQTTAIALNEIEATGEYSVP